MNGFEMTYDVAAPPSAKTIRVFAHGVHQFVTVLGNLFAGREITPPAKTVARQGKLDDFHAVCGQSGFSRIFPF